jgi:hypothetical protein
MVRMLKQNKLARLIFGHYLMVRSKCCILAKKYNKNQKCVFGFESLNFTIFQKIYIFVAHFLMYLFEASKQKRMVGCFLEM